MEQIGYGKMGQVVIPARDTLHLRLLIHGFRDDTPPTRAVNGRTPSNTGRRGASPLNTGGQGGTPQLDRVAVRGRPRVLAPC